MVFQYNFGIGKFGTLPINVELVFVKVISKKLQAIQQKRISQYKRKKLRTRGRPHMMSRS